MLPNFWFKTSHSDSHQCDPAVPEATVVKWQNSVSKPVKMVMLAGIAYSARFIAVNMFGVYGQ